jgi:energy-coupling factor transport system substrate-specific component
MIRRKKMGQNEKMKGKDYIACGILSLMNMVGMLVAAVMNISGYTALLYGAVAAFFIGILYVIVSCKVPKFGAILIFTIVPCLYFFTSGVIEGIIGAVGALFFAFMAELIRKRDYLSMKRITVSGVVYTLYMSTLGSAENFIFTDRYCDAALEHGINETVVEQMRQMYYIKPLWLAVIVVTALTTFLGICLGRAIMKKHLKKAGIV